MSLSHLYCRGVLNAHPILFSSVEVSFIHSHPSTVEKCGEFIPPLNPSPSRVLEPISFSHHLACSCSSGWIILFGHCTTCRPTCSPISTSKSSWPLSTTRRCDIGTFILLGDNFLGLFIPKALLTPTQRPCGSSRRCSQILNIKLLQLSLDGR